MAQLKDLIVTGSARFLNEIKGKLDWSNILNKPTLGTASEKDVPASGDASSTEVVMGNDSRLSDSRTPSFHTHGNIQNGGTLQTNDVAIASGDKLVVTDSSDSSKIARTSTSFDGSTTTKALTQKGTFETFLQSHQTIKQDGVVGATVNRFGTCSTGASTAAKTVSITTGTFSLEAGATVFVKFSNSNTAGAPTLNVNSTGAKSIKQYSTTAPGTTTNTSWQAGEVLCLVYDGSYWQIVDRVYTSLAATSGGTDVSLVTTGEKYLWNTKAGSDVNVTQTAVTSSSSSQYRLLLSHSASDNEETEGVYKHTNLIYQPSIGCLFLKDYDISRGSLNQILPNQINIATTGGGVNMTSDDGGSVTVGKNYYPSSEGGNTYSLINTTKIESGVKGLDSQSNEYQLGIRLSAGSGDVELYGGFGGNTLTWDGTNTSLKTAITSLNTTTSGKVTKSGDTMTGNLVIDGGNVQIKKTTGRLQVYGGDIHLGTVDSTSNDSGDLAWFYGNGQEKSRIWMDNAPTTKLGADLNFRAYKSDGTQLIADTKLLTRRDITTVNTSESKACKTTWSYTGMSYVVPAYSVSVVTVRATWTNSVPKLIGVSTSSTSATGGTLVAMNTVGSVNDNLTTTATVVNNTSSDKTYYIWAQYNGNTNNTIQLIGFHIPYNP